MYNGYETILKSLMLCVSPYRRRTAHCSAAWRSSRRGCSRRRGCQRTGPSGGRSWRGSWGAWRWRTLASKRRWSPVRWSWSSWGSRWSRTERSSRGKGLMVQVTWRKEIRFLWYLPHQGWVFFLLFILLFLVVFYYWFFYFMIISSRHKYQYKYNKIII